MSYLTLLRRLTPLFALALLLALGGAAMAQPDPGRPAEPDPAPVRPQEPREVCVPAGLALTVINADDVLAEAMPLPARNDSDRPDPNVDPARRIVVEGPVLVGACAEYQGFWSEGAGGTGAARLVVFQHADATAAAALNPVARDGVEKTLRGPARLSERLKAVTALREPGTYYFTAVLTAVAEKPATSAAVEARDEDAHRTRFVVEIRKPPEKGAIEGTVYGEHGEVLAGARVAAVPARRESGSGDRIEAPTLVGTAAETTVQSVAGKVPFGPVPEAGPTVVTDREGKYRIEVPAGAYTVMAAARGYRVQWYRGADSAANATPVRVGSGATTGGIDFRLRKAPEPPPVAMGWIRGKVVSEGDSPTPIGGATVVARRAPEEAPGRPLQDDPVRPEAGPVATTGRDGTYAIQVPEGRYYVVAQARGFGMEWYREAEGPDGAEIVPVGADTERDDVDFTLAPASAPEPPEPVAHGLIEGTVLAGETPLAGAMVVARRAPGDRDLPLQDPADPSLGPVARTDENGAYVLRVPEGGYLVMAQAEGYAPQWFDGVKEPGEATRVKVSEARPATGIDFDLEPAARPEPPVPSDGGWIAGRLEGIDGRTTRARVFAVPVDRLPDDPSLLPPGALPFPTDVPATATREDGTYRLPAPPGAYIVALVVSSSDRASGLRVLYYDGVDEIDEATEVTVIAGETTEDVDFLLE